MDESIFIFIFHRNAKERYRVTCRKKRKELAVGLRSLLAHGKMKCIIIPVMHSEIFKGHNVKTLNHSTGGGEGEGHHRLIFITKLWAGWLSSFHGTMHDSCCVSSRAFLGKFPLVPFVRVSMLAPELHRLWRRTNMANAEDEEPINGGRVFSAVVHRHLASGSIVLSPRDGALVNGTVLRARRVS